MRTLSFLFILSLLASCAGEPHTLPIGTDEEFLNLAQNYAQGLFAFRPVYASRLGINRFQGDLPDYSPRAVEEEILRIDASMERLDALPAGKLSPRNLSDLELLRASMNAWRSRLTQKAAFKRDPLFYNDLIVQGIELLMHRDYAPAQARMEALLDRILSIPYFLEVARVNLTETPEVLRASSENALVNTMVMLRDNLPLRIRDQLDGRLPEGFEEAHIKAVYAFMDYILFVKDRLKYRSDADYAIGEGLYLERWRNEEFIDVSVEGILELCAASREILQAEMMKAASLIAPEKELALVMEDLGEEHESVKGVKDRSEELVPLLKAFVSEHDLVSLPFDDKYELDVLDPDPRTNAPISYLPPGVMDPNCRKGFYSINPIPPLQDGEGDRNAYLRFFTQHSIVLITAGVSYPGWFVQSINSKRPTSYVARTMEPATLIEGWASYCRDLILENGFDPRPEVLLTNLKLSLLDVNRLEAAARIHCRGMDIREAVAFLSTQSFIDPAMARREVVELVRNPKAGAGFIGREQIMKLRNLFLAGDGELTQKQFHDLLLSAGLIPLPVLARQVFGKEI